MKKRIRVAHKIRLSAWVIVSRAVEEGIAYAHAREARGKEPATPENLEMHIMNALAEVIDFDPKE